MQAHHEQVDVETFDVAPRSNGAVGKPGFRDVHRDGGKRQHISSSIRLQDKGLKQGTNKNFLNECASCDKSMERQSMYDYFHAKKNGSKTKKKNQKTIIPHFIGVNGVPCFPVSE